MRATLLAFVIASTAFHPLAARADQVGVVGGAPAVATVAHPPRGERFRAAPIAVEANLGIATPIGCAGVDIDYSPVPFIGLTAGVGTNLHGAEFSLMPRVRLLLDDHRALYFGAGLSFGHYVQTDSTGLGIGDVFIGPLHQICENCVSLSYDWSLAYFANLEFGFEARAPSGLAFRAFVGPALLLNTKPSTTEVVDSQGYSDPTREVPVHTWMPYMGFALGYAFGI